MSITIHPAKSASLYDLHLRSGRAQRIPIGINIPVSTCDRAQARHKVRAHYSNSDDAQVIVFFGFLHPVKGLETLLSAFKRVVSANPKARLLLVGGVESLALDAQQAADYWRKLESAIAQLNLQNVVYMTGFVDEATASEYLLGADIGVLPFNQGVTLKSGSLLALMAHSLPVVATRSPNPDPELDNRDLLCLIPPRDDEALAAELLNLLGDRHKQTQLGEAGHAFSHQFAWSAIAKSHVDVYQRAIKRYSR
jgi:polysaccharide biosynthesis protein PslF